MAIVLGIAILISGLSPSSSAPTSNLEWWNNPCTKQPPIRHGRSTAESQLNIIISIINRNLSKDIKHLYKPAENKKMKGNCPRINNMLKPIRSATTFTTATNVFYETLLEFARFIDRLKGIPIKTTGQFNSSKRDLIFEEAKQNLKLLICEFNETIGKHDKRKTQPEKRKVPKINMKCLPKKMDLSQAHLMDTDFFNKLKYFLKQSKKILKLKKQKKGKKVVKKSEPKSKRTRNLKQ